MKRTWHPSIVGALIGVALMPLSILSSIASAGAGHGNYVAAKVWFPLTMLSAYILGSITTPFVVLSVVQFPILGWLIGRGVGSVRRWVLFSVISSAHLVLVLAAFNAPGSWK